MLPSNDCYISIDAGQAVLFDEHRIERLRFELVEDVGDGAARRIARVKSETSGRWDISYEMETGRIIAIEPGECAEPTISYEEVNDG
jgi:hypothetical protein